MYRRRLSYPLGSLDIGMVEEIKLSHVSCRKVVEPPAQGLNIGIVSCLWYYTHTGIPKVGALKKVYFPQKINVLFNISIYLDILIWYLII